MYIEGINYFCLKVTFKLVFSEMRRGFACELLKNLLKICWIVKSELITYLRNIHLIIQQIFNRLLASQLIDMIKNSNTRLFFIRCTQPSSICVNCYSNIIQR